MREDADGAIRRAPVLSALPSGKDLPRGIVEKQQLGRQCESRPVAPVVGFLLNQFCHKL